MQMKCYEKILIKNLFCVTVPFIELAVSHTSVLTILAITVERLVHPPPPLLRPNDTRHHGGVPSDYT